ncbi:uncharacterized protein TNCV_4134951 [Trichonephila clavipes]|nr:uncharacterized protein TNCV_4134951 [Trichonephila clavipes]
MNFFSNFNRSTPRETSVITLTEEHSQIITNRRYPNYDIPILFKSMRWIGLAQEPTRHPLARTAAITFKIVLIFINLDAWISSGVSFHSLNLIATCANLAIRMLVTGTYIAMHYKRNLLTITFHNLGSSPNDKVNKFIVIAIGCLPAIFSAFCLIEQHDNPMISRLETYGYTIGDITVNVMLLSLKSLLYSLVHPTFTSLVSLSYCILCQLCCSQINNLTENVLQYSPDEFGPMKQLDILRQKAKIDNILENVQAIFRFHPLS